MCKRRDSIEAQNCAADRLTKACTARRTFVVLGADRLRDPAPLKCLPEQPSDFAELLAEIDAKDPRPNGRKRKQNGAANASH